MILSVSITPEWLASFTVLESRFFEAKAHFDNEDFQFAREILEGIYIEETHSKGVGNISNLQVLVMYGWTLYRQKDFQSFRELFSNLSDINLVNYPDLEVLRLWEFQYSGKLQELYDGCTLNLEFHDKKVESYYAYFLLMKGSAAADFGKTQEAIELGEASYSIFLLCSNPEGAGYASNYLGIFNRQISDFRESLKWYQRALETFKCQSWQRRKSMVLLNTGVTQYKLGRFEESKESLGKSFQIGVEKNLPYRQLLPLIGLGNVHRFQRNFSAAREMLHKSYALAQELKFPRNEALSLEFLGDVYRDEGNFSEARLYYNRTMALAKLNAPDGDLVMEAHRRLGECHNLEGNYTQAMKELKTALSMAQSQGDRYEEAATLRIMAETSRNTFDHQSADTYIQESIKILRSIEANYELAVSLLTGAEITFAQLENPNSLIPKKIIAQKAWDQSTKALDLFIQINIPWWVEKTRVMVGQIVNTRSAMDRAERTGNQIGDAKNRGTYDPGDAIIHSSSLMKDLLDLCDMFAVSDEPVLILGETGTGKEIIAKRIHRTSKCSNGELVTVNVAAIPEQMFEREFFGHVRGSFSGADRDGKGYAAQAHGGTLFLDEIGDLPLDAQAKLLRLLQDGTYQALGDPKQRHAEIRIIAATNADLPRLVAEGKFRSDLYYRLRILELPIPALRDRPDDVLPLLRHFLSVAAKSPRELTEYFNRSSLDLLEQYDWPGNVREVSMLARRAHVEMISRGRVKIEIQRRDKESLLMTGPGFLAMEKNAATMEHREASAAATVSPGFERTRILRALQKAAGNRNTAAQDLGISRSTLYRKMEKFDIGE